jgi:hypothetical protein
MDVDVRNDHMGAVALKERFTGLVDRGYPVSEATLYIYCDACGSFNIKTYIPFFKLFITTMIISGGIFLVLGEKQWWCLIPLTWLLLFLPWKDILLRYKCRKCGNAHITNYNTMHYPSYDSSVIDVPDRLAQKRYIDTDVLHFQQFT